MLWDGTVEYCIHNCILRSPEMNIDNSFTLLYIFNSVAITSLSTASIFYRFFHLYLKFNNLLMHIPTYPLSTQQDQLAITKCQQQNVHNTNVLYCGIDQLTPPNSVLSVSINNS